MLNSRCSPSEVHEDRRDEPPDLPAQGRAQPARPIGDVSHDLDRPRPSPPSRSGRRAGARGLSARNSSPCWCTRRRATLATISRIVSGRKPGGPVVPAAVEADGVPRVLALLALGPLAEGLGLGVDAAILGVVGGEQELAQLAAGLLDALLAVDPDGVAVGPGIDLRGDLQGQQVVRQPSRGVAVGDGPDLSHRRPPLRFRFGPMLPESGRLMVAWTPGRKGDSSVDSRRLDRVEFRAPSGATGFASAGRLRAPARPAAPRKGRSPAFE